MRLILSILFPFILSLSAANSQEIDAEELPGILDNDSIPVRLFDSLSTSYVDFEDFVWGDSSLKIVPLYESGASSVNFHSNLTFQISGPGIVEFYLKPRAVSDSRFTLGEKWISSYYVGVTESGWQRYQYFLGDPGKGRTLYIEGARYYESEGEPSLGIDKVSFRPGYQILSEDPNPQVGQLSISPAKEAYEIGDVVSVSASALPGFRVEGVSFRDLSQNHYSYPHINEAQFDFAVTGHSEIVGLFAQRLDFPDVEAWASVAEEPLDQVGSAYFIESLKVEGLDQSGILRFEAMPQQNGRLKVGNSEELLISEDAENFVEYEFLYQTPPGQVTISYNRYEEAKLALRNLSYDDSDQIILTQLGRGVVEIAYDSVTHPSKTVASLNATPADGWEFFGWAQGPVWDRSIISKAASDKLYLDGPVPLIALFGQAFSLGGSRWSIIHDGDTLIETDASGDRLKIHPNANRPELECHVELLREGLASANVVVTDALNESVINTTQFFDPHTQQPFYALTAPLAYSRTIAPSADGYTYIQDVVVSDGGGYDDVGFQITGPEGAVIIEPQKDAYLYQETIHLSIAEAFKDRFVAWTGDFYSEDLQLDLTLEAPFSLIPIFEQELPKTDGVSMRTRGAVMLSPIDSDAMAAFQAIELPAAAWTEIELDVEAPLTIAYDWALNNIDNLNLSFWQGTEEIDPTRIRNGFCTLDPNLVGPFRIRIENTSNHSISFQITFLGLYQKNQNLDGIRHYSIFVGGDLLMDPSEPYLPVGSVISLVPQADNHFVFQSWITPALSPEARQYTVKRDEVVYIEPHFHYQMGIQNVAHLAEQSSGWIPSSNLFPSFKTTNYENTNKQNVVSFQIQGPGVFAFDLTHRSFNSGTGLVDTRATIGGVETEIAELNFGLDGLAQGILVDDGLHTVSISVRATEKGLDDDYRVYASELRNVAFHPGYLVGSLYRMGPNFFHWKSGETNENYYADRVYADGDIVELEAVTDADLDFGDWTGDLSGRPASTTFKADRHRRFNAVSRLPSIGPVRTAISPWAIFNYSGNWHIENESGPCSITMEVPEQTELSFYLRSDSVPVEVFVDDEIFFQGAISEDTLFPFPVKESAFVVTIHMDLNKETEGQVTFSELKGLQRFSVTGDFGDEHEYVTLEPFKDTYALGEKVQVKLDNDAPSHFVFGDLLATYPNLARAEWIDVFGKKSFELEIVSETILLGDVGPLPTRNPGDLVFGEEISLSPSGTTTPDGSSALQGKFFADSLSYLRIYAPNKRHAILWLKIPKLQYWIFDDGLGEGSPLTIEGTGEWIQVSIPVPEDSDYLSAFLYYTLSSSDSFLISEVNLLDGYGIPFVSQGNGFVTITPESGAESMDSPITLTAEALSYSVFEGWTQQQNATDSQLQTSPSENSFLFPSFAPIPQPLDYASFELGFLGIKPTTEYNRITLSDPSTRLLFEVTGPGRIAYQANVSSGASLQLDLNGSKGIVHSAYGFTNHIDSSGNNSHPTNTAILKIPAGRHSLAFSFRADQDARSGEINGLRFEPGAYLTKPLNPLGSVEISPNKTFYDLGERVTLKATPQNNYVFTNWLLDLQAAPAEPSYSLEVQDHLDIDAAFRYHRIHQAPNLTWEISSDLENGAPSKAAAEITGPAFLRVHQSALDRNPAPRLIIGGRAAEYFLADDFAYILIPEGKRSFVFSSDGSADSFATSVSYFEGYAVALDGDTEGLRIEPQQESYLAGQSLSLNWVSSAYIPPLQESILINGKELAHQLPLSLTVSEHQRLRIERSQRLHLSNWLTGPNASGYRFHADPTGDEPVIELFRGQNDRFRPIRYQTDEAGILSFTAELLDWNKLELSLNGTPLDLLETGGTYSYKLPSGTHRFEWSLSPFSSRLYDTAFLSNVTFVPQSMTDFESWIADQVPLPVYSKSQNLLPSDDLDGDGYSNLRERNNGTHPYQYTILADIGQYAAYSPKPSLTFDLPDGVPATEIDLLTYQAESQSWLVSPLDSLKRFAEAQGDDRVRYYIPIDQFDQTSSLYRIGIRQ